MKNKVKSLPESIDVTAPTGGYTAGTLEILRSGTGGRCMVPMNTVAAGEQTPASINGEFKLPAESGTGKTFAVGDLLYRKASDKKLTKTATGNTLAGYCSRAKGASETSGYLMLNG